MQTQLEHFANDVLDYIPGIFGALLVLLIGWLIAKGIKAVIIRLLRKTSWDERLFRNSGMGDTNVFFGNIFYYVIMIIVLLIVLEILGVEQVLSPLENMLNEFLAFIPNLIGAVLIGFIGYLLAKFVSNLINIGGNFLDKVVDRTGFKDTSKLVNILRKVVFFIIFVPFLIQAFNALELDAISGPANNILSGFFAMLGEIIIASLILIVFIWGGKYLADFLEDLFKSLGLDRTANKIHMQNMIGADQSLSKVIANVIYFFLVFFGVITAVEILGLTQLTDTLDQILELTGQILFGLLILAVGNYISMLIYNTMTKSRDNTFIAGVVRYAALALFIAIALRTMGIANEIVELAFGLTLGAIAVAVALSYGLGGRDAAGAHFRDIIARFRSEVKTPADSPKGTTSIPKDAPRKPDSNKNDLFSDGNSPSGKS